MPRYIATLNPLAFLLCGIFLAPISTAAEVLPCSGPSRPAIEVVPRLSEPQFNSHTPAEQLSLASDISRPGGTDGLTDFQVAGDLHLQERTASDGCPFRVVQAVIRASRLEVYVAKEVAPTSCRFRAVYAHEMRHVMLVQRVIDRSEAPLRKQLKSAVAALPADAAQDWDALRAVLRPILDANLVALMVEYSKGNEDLDTPAEALRMAEACQEPQTFLGSTNITGGHSPGIR